jgi:hypothetical protein
LQKEGFAERGVCRKRGLQKEDLQKEGFAERGVCRKRGLQKEGFAERGFVERGSAERGFAERGVCKNLSLCDRNRDGPSDRFCHSDRTTDRGYFRVLFL